jgi:hypothetical protein
MTVREIRRMQEHETTQVQQRYKTFIERLGEDHSMVGFLKNIEQH